jgi:hypothetical protein
MQWKGTHTNGSNAALDGLTKVSDGRDVQIDTTTDTSQGKKTNKITTPPAM